jgi:hypothetical protein
LIQVDYQADLPISGRSRITLVLDEFSKTSDMPPKGACWLMLKSLEMTSFHVCLLLSLSPKLNRRRQTNYAEQSSILFVTYNRDDLEFHAGTVNHSE